MTVATTGAMTGAWGRCRCARWFAALAVAATAPPIAAASAVYPGAGGTVVAIEQRLGATLPLDKPFVDADGRAVRLDDYFGVDSGGNGVPVVLVLGYYNCRHLCQTVAQGAVEALAESGAAPTAYRVLTVSIDPNESAADARSARERDQAWAAMAFERAGVGAVAHASPLQLDALVGPAASVDALAAAVGFGFRPFDARESSSGDDPGFAHAAGFVVVTPGGRVSRYFLGVRHDPRSLAAALRTAEGDAVGGLVDRLVLLCAHIDPTLGRYSEAVLIGLRVFGVGLVLALAAWIWRHRQPSPSGRSRP